MIVSLAADLVVLIHLAFICFVIAGALLVYRWRWLVWLHIPAVVWAVLLEFNGWLCPLTPLENRLRLLAGEQGYTGGFIEHYLVPVIYPQFLSRDIQLLLGIIVLVLNLAIYFYVLRAWRSASTAD